MIRVIALCCLVASAAFAETAADQLKVLKDFRVDLLYTVPKADQGSWVAMTVDPKGRLIVSDQYGKLYRVVVPPIGSAEQPKISPIEAPIGQAQGLLYAFDSLYVMVANKAYEGQGLYRIRDTDGDDQFDEVKLLRKIDGGGEHGPHAILLAPDGKSLYIVAGNQTKLTEMSSSRVPLHWSEDHLLPRLWDGNGFMKGVLAPGGWIARIDPDGKDWELICNGFRNEYDAAFNRNGDLFTFDADMEWDMNTPWYRPTRVCMVASGAEFGWRSGAGKWPAYYPDSLPAVVDIGPGSPTGVTFGYGAKFPAKYQEALYICDWSYGKLYAVHLNPEGSAYRGEAEEFVTGSPLALTDLVISPRDGAMYFAVGGRKTQSALYRVTYTGSQSTAVAKADNTGAREREIRRKLESFHGHKDPKAIEEAWPYLGNKDRFLRFAARIALEHQDVGLWRDKALAETDPEASINVLIGLIRSSARDQFHRKPSDPPVDPALPGRVVASLDRIAWKKLNEPQQLELLRAYSLAFVRLGKPESELRERMIAKFDPVFPAKSRELNAELAQMLVYLEAPKAATKLITMLAKAPTQEEQMDYARDLRVLKTGWTMDQRREYFNWFVKAGGFRGGASLGGFLRDIKADAVSNLAETVRAELQPIIDLKPDKTLRFASLGERTVQREWTVEELDRLAAKKLKDRNFDRGREVFGSVGCFACHRFANEGGAIGPDLTGVSGRFSVRDLIESIVDPSKEVSDQYAAIVIEKNDGTDVTGRIANLSDNNIMVNANMYDPNDIVRVNRKDIKSIHPSKVSMMPTGLLNVLKEDEILDLMAFLLSRGQRDNKMFTQR